jgi:hypothetical protein
MVCRAGRVEKMRYQEISLHERRFSQNLVTLEFLGTEDCSS